MKTVSRIHIAFAALVSAQTAHSVEEYAGRLWESFPPAAFLTSLISPDRALGFVVINSGLVAFGWWCLFWPVQGNWSSAPMWLWFWIVIETINGVGHPVWSVAQGGYTPGVATAPILLSLALYLAFSLRGTSRPVSPPSGLEMRRADPIDVEAIADAHRDSIRSIGPAFYPSEDVTGWAEGLNGAVYLKAMVRGEVFFIATEQIDGVTRVLGFATDCRLEGTTDGTSVYVRGDAARRGIGTALLRLAEAHAAANGATSIRIEASLAGAAFYRANGYIEAGRGETRLMSGYEISCVFMRKEIGNDAPNEPG